MPKGLTYETFRYVVHWQIFTRQEITGRSCDCKEQKSCVMPFILFYLLTLLIVNVKVNLSLCVIN
jgi:hypothetical protein